MTSASSVLSTRFALDLTTGNARVTYVDITLDADVTSSLVYHVGLAAGGGGVPGALFAFDANGQDDIFRYDRPGFGRTEILPNILSSFTTAGGGDLASYAVADVPEPISGALLVVGAVATGVLRRRGQASALSTSPAR